MDITLIVLICLALVSYLINMKDSPSLPPSRRTRDRKEFKMKLLLTALLLTLGFSAQALELGQTAPCVVLEHLNTNGSTAEHCIRDHSKNQTHTLIEFFSITCSACQENHPKITALGQSLNDVATTRFISIDRNKQSVLDYVNARRAEFVFEVAFDTDRDAKKAYEVNATPTLYILNHNNAVVYKHVGVLSTTDVEQITKIVRGL